MSTSHDEVVTPAPDRTYGQYCGLAQALDLVGERWALLVVRELVLGPKRFTDLLDGLPGINNILATRLRQLERAGVVARNRLPPPAASSVYELTEYGTRSSQPSPRWAAGAPRPWACAPTRLCAPTGSRSR